MPDTNPVMPKIMMVTSFQSFQWCLPSWSGQSVIISMNGGKMSARAELLNAPTREMIPLKFGISAAAETGTIVINNLILKIHSYQC